LPMRNTEVVLRGSVSLVCCTAIPLHYLAFVFVNARAIPIRRTHLVLSFSVSLLRHVAPDAEGGLAIHRFDGSLGLVASFSAEREGKRTGGQPDLNSRSKDTNTARDRRVLTANPISHDASLTFYASGQGNATLAVGSRSTNYFASFLQGFLLSGN